MSTVISMNEETRRMDPFNDIMANITPLMAVGKRKNQGVVTGSSAVPLSLCFVDSRYQGMRTHKDGTISGNPVLLRQTLREFIPP